MIEIYNEFYVYEWIRLDNNEPFYVGKGKNDRWCKLTRENNYHFNNIVKTIPVVVNILENNLSEEDAFKYECWYINEYKYEFGYNLVNMTDGGENPPTLKGDLNGNYMNYWTKEQKERQREKMLDRYDGKCNPNSKKIMCIETGEKFDCILDAQIKYNIKTYSSLTIALNNKKSRVAGGLHWVILTDENTEFFNNKDTRFKYLLECLILSENIKYYIDIDNYKIFNRKQLEKEESISTRKFKEFIKSNKKYMLVSEFYSRFIQ